MLTASGPKLLEYNVRFGDPECQVLCMRLMSDLLTALVAAHDGVLDTFHLRWHEDTALTVVMAAQGYPDSYDTGSEISGLDKAVEAGNDGNVVIFHAGTDRDETGKLVANGGRVLNVTAMGSSVSIAQTRAYAAVHAIDWPAGFYRGDIGWRAIKSEDH